MAEIFAPTTKGYEVSAETKATQKFRQIFWEGSGKVRGMVGACCIGRLLGESEAGSGEVDRLHFAGPLRFR